MLHKRGGTLMLLGRSSTRLFSKIASIFKEMLQLKDLNRHLDCTDVSFNTENSAFPNKKKSDTQIDRQTDRQSDYYNPRMHVC